MRAYKKSAQSNTINSHNSLPYYSPKAKKPVRFFTEDLRANGYYCTNNSKEDYKMITSPLAWTIVAKKHTGEIGKMISLFSLFSILNDNTSQEFGRII